MARLSGVDLPREKRLIIALTYIYGVGPTRAKETIEATGLSPDLRARDLTRAPGGERVAGVLGDMRHGVETCAAWQ